MNADNAIRDKFGLLICICELEKGKSRIILDDVTNISENGRGDWTHKTFVTWKDYDSITLNELALSDEEFSSFGRCVLARILAVNNVRRS